MKSPIYTEKTICRDCYKCVRECPVKAIKVENGSAVIMHELCIFCGKCIEVCPVNAKKSRSDVVRARQMIKLNDSVIASIAPSFPAEFDCSAPELIKALKKLGFYGVSETSIGAEIVSQRAAEKLNKGEGMMISSACPTVKELIRKYRPSLVSRMSDLASPLEAHAAILKETYGKNTRVIFIGPCISKKLEADDDSSDIDLALTFAELREWLESEEIIFDTAYPDDEACFIPERMTAAAEFAVEGGMLNTIRADASTIEPDLISCSGIGNILSTFDDVAALDDHNIFLEYLACDGGCISGRGMSSRQGYLEKRIKVLNYCRSSRKKIKDEVKHFNVEKIIYPAPVTAAVYTEQEINDVLISLDKRSREDEMDCGGCGYNTCRDFAAALLAEKAEQTMCVTNMRKLAEKKSNALMKALPLGAVIVDGNENILECNGKFINLFTDIDISLTTEAENRVAGLELKSFVPDNHIFDQLKQSDMNMTENKLRIKDRVFRTFAFRIGKEEMLGAVFQDITSPAVRRETIIKKTEEVIEKSLNSVQQIASLLGENAAETQLILNSLIESYSENGDHR